MSTFNVESQMSDAPNIFEGLTSDCGLTSPSGVVGDSVILTPSSGK